MVKNNSMKVEDHEEKTMIKRCESEGRQEKKLKFVRYIKISKGSNLRRISIVKMYWNDA